MNIRFIFNLVPFTLLTFVTTLMTGVFVKAQTSEVSQEITEPPTTQSIIQAPAPIENPRGAAKYLASVSYSALEVPIPNKFGVTLGMIRTPTQTWELEYMRGTLSVPGGFRDLGGIRDTRVSVNGRTYFGNSFHVSYGLSYFDFSADIGSELINNVSGGVYPSMNALHVQGLGLNGGFGNIWVFNKKITFGVDWFSWAQPLTITRSTSDFLRYSQNPAVNRYVSDTIKVISYFPRLSLFHIHVGMLF